MELSALSLRLGVLCLLCDKKKFKKLLKVRFIMICLRKCSINFYRKEGKERQGAKRKVLNLKVVLSKTLVF